MFRDRQPQDQPARAQRIFEDRMGQIFERLPMLDGFCVESDLTISEVSLHTWPGLDRTHEVAGELAGFLEDPADFVDDAQQIIAA